jgi:hypothetical protein
MYTLRHYKKKIVSRAEIKIDLQNFDVPPGFLATRLVAVAAPAGIEAAHAAASSTPAAEMAPCAAAATAIAATTVVAASSPTATAAVILRPSAARLAVAGVATSHFPVRAPARCAASVAAGHPVASVIGVAAAAVSSATPTAVAARAAEPLSLAQVAGRSLGLFISVTRAPRALPAARRRRLRSAGTGNLLDQIQCHLGVDMSVRMDRITRPPPPAWSAPSSPCCCCRRRPAGSHRGPSPAPGSS